MALQIKETPVLHGEDARRFAENARSAMDRPVPREEYERAYKIFVEMEEKQEQGI